MSAVLIRGAKGGSQQHTPTESPDNLRSIAYFRILDLVSEGEIGGLVNGQQSIYLDETPLVNSDGSANFPKAHVETRTGTQDQDVIPGFDSVENEISVGVELKSTAPWVQALSDTTLSSVRVTIGVPALSKANTSNGDITGYTINYTIEVSTDGGAYVLAYNGSFKGKTTSKYQRSHRIDLPTATTGWNVRVTRLTANANNASTADTTTIDSYTEIVDAKLRYPNSALVALMGDASQFSNIPNRAYDLFGRIIQVPSNYDVVTRSYSGTWDGTFKPSWTDNPAWIFYDLVTHPRYGLGHLVAAALVDKWELYKIGQYCDGLVDDGMGGQEPRLTCNVFLQTQADAYKLLNDLSSAFRGISYWANGTIVASADMPSDPVFTYTDANVIGGQFSYSASARKTRFTTALVSWNDPRNFYRTKVEYVEDRDGIARYGIQQTAVTAVGCTSQGQAQRLGRWILLTSRLETDTVTFKVGLDGVLVAPGQIIRVADSARAGKRQGGRIVAATTTTVTLDKAPTVAAGDTITVGMPDGVSQTRTVLSVDGATVTTSTAFTDVPVAQAAWTVESGTLAAQTFRVLAVVEDKSDTEISFTITALQHNASKFDAVDFGTLIQVPPISALTITNQAGPAAVSLESAEVVDPAATTQLLTIAWTAVPGALAYEVEWRKDDGEWRPLGLLTGLSSDLRGTGAGDYVARVRAKGTGQAYSLYSYSNTFTLGAATTLPTTVAGIQAEANQAATDAAAANAQLADIASDNLLTPGEKPIVIRDWNVISAEQAGIDAQATAYGITTEKSAYDAAVTALANYQGTLTSPVLWSSLSGNTTIDGPTFRQKFADVYTTRQTLLNAIYAAAKAKADAAQATANTATGQVTQLPVINGGFDIAPTGYGWNADAGSGWTIDTAGNTPGVGPNSAMHAAGAGGGAYRNAGLAACLPGQVYKAQGLIKAVGANGACWVYISWCNAAGAEIGSTAGNQITGTTTTGSYVVGTAPAGTVYARTCLGVSGHTAGTYYVDNVLCSQYPSSVGEVPDGGGRYAVHQVDANGLAVIDFSQSGHVNKNLGNIADGGGFARVKSGQLSNGVIQLLGSGRNAIFNPSFTQNAGGYTSPQPTVFGYIRDGWQLLSKTDAGINPLYDAGGPGIGFIFGPGIVVPASGSAQGSWYSSPFAVQPSATYALRIMRQIFLAQALPAGLTAVSSAALDFYDATGAYLSTSAFYEKTGAFSNAYDVNVGAVPAGARTARLQLFGLLRNSTGSAITTASSNTAEPLFISVEFVQASDLSNEVMGTLSTQRNMPYVTWGNYGGMWSGLTLTYSTTTTSCTFSASAASYVGGGDSVAYNPSSVSVSGTAGSTVTYYLYYDDPTMVGGSKSLQVTTSQITSLNANGRVLVTAVKVTYPTSGTGGGSDTGGCPQVDEPVIRRAPDGNEEVSRAGDVRVGDYVLSPSGRWLQVTHSEPTLQPCVRVTFEDGEARVFSATAPLQDSTGRPVLAPFTQGRVLRHRDAGSMRVAAVRDAGVQWVQHITAENDYYLVGNFAHHNRKPLPGG
jgi:hypothetical protein